MTARLTSDLLLRDSSLDSERRVFVESAREWLNERAPRHERVVRSVSLFPDIDQPALAKEVARARAWEAEKFDGGWAGIQAPTYLGGRGGSLLEDYLFRTIEREYDLPRDIFTVTQQMVVPTFMACGTEAQQRQFIPRALSGEHLWCQMFSEPGAGSDIAAIECKAMRTDAGWQIQGQKIWTSYAQHSDYGYLLARTSHKPKPHDGLTAFVVDMSLPGMTVQPIRQGTGAYTYCEVFLDDVILPNDCVIGDVDRGWKVAITTLMNERLCFNPRDIPLERFVSDTRPHISAEDSGARRAAAALGKQVMIDALGRQILSEVSGPSEVGPETTLVKLLAVEASFELADAAVDMAAKGNISSVDTWWEYAIGVVGMSIGGGTNEILKDVIANRLLHLPRAL